MEKNKEPMEKELDDTTERTLRNFLVMEKEEADKNLSEKLEELQNNDYVNDAGELVRTHWGKRKSGEKVKEEELPAEITPKYLDHVLSDLIDLTLTKNALEVSEEEGLMNEKTEQYMEKKDRETTGYIKEESENPNVFLDRWEENIDQWKQDIEEEMENRI